MYFYSGVPGIEIQDGNTLYFYSGVPGIEIQDGNTRWNTLYFYSGVPGIEIQDGILCISILHSVLGIEIIRFIKHHVKADIQNEKNTCRPIKTTGRKRYLAAS